MNLSRAKDIEAERQASGAAASRSDAGAEDVGGRLQSCVELSAPRSQALPTPE
jgi:hypothetical protein